MSDKIDDIVIPILRNIQGDISVLKSDVSLLKEDVSLLKEDVSLLKEDVSVLKESVRRIDARMGTMEYYQTAFHSSLRSQQLELDELRGRVETLEDEKRPRD